MMRYGRRGQKQSGVDLIGYRASNDNWVGVQCKLRSGGKLSSREVEPDVKAAVELNPRLSEFVIATTANRDTELQDFARQCTERNLRDNLFVVDTFFWEDFEAFLQDESNLDILSRHYSDFMVQVLPTGLAVAKMLSLRLGVERLTTLYEVIIGKTVAAREGESSQYNLGYFKNLTFMVNLQTRRAAVFRWPMRHFSDIESAIGNRTDEYIIAKLLSRFSSVDEFLGSTDEELSLTIPREEWWALHPPKEPDES
jgi:hypothetical protein